MATLNTKDDAPYIDQSGDERALDKAQFGVLLDSLDDNTLLASKKLGYGITGSGGKDMSKGPEIVDGSNTQAFVDAIFDDRVDAALTKDQLKISIIGGTMQIEVPPPPWLPHLPPTIEDVIKPTLSVNSPIIIDSSIDESTVSPNSPIDTDTSYNSSVFGDVNALFNNNSSYDNQNLKLDVRVKYAGAEVAAGGVQLKTVDDAGESVSSVIPAINTSFGLGADAKQSALTTESEVWIKGVGDWRRSQTEGAPTNNPYWTENKDVYDALVSLNPSLSSQIAISRLNLIPVTNADKILNEDLEVDMESQVNLLEATWTIWKSLMNINTEVYGISGTSTNASIVEIADPSGTGTQLLPALSGNVRENLNFIYTTLSGHLATAESGGSTGLSALSASLFGDSFTDTLDIPLSGYSIVHNLNRMYNELFADEYWTPSFSSESGDLGNLTDSPIITGLSACCELNAHATDLNYHSITAHDAEIDILQDDVESLKLVTSLSALSGEIEKLKSLTKNIGNISTNEYNIGVNATDIQSLSAALEVFQPNDKFKLCDFVKLQSYLEYLSGAEQLLVDLGPLSACCIDKDLVLALSGDVDNMLTIINTTAELQYIVEKIPALSAIIVNASNIENVQVLIDNLSGNELKDCCDKNASDIVALQQTVSEVLSAGITDLESEFQDLSGSLTSLPGYVKTTGTQAVSGEKTFEHTFTVAASSYLEDSVIVGDPNTPTIFNVSSTEGVTTLNILSLPTEAQLDSLNLGDVYTKVIDGTTVLAIKT